MQNSKFTDLWIPRKSRAALENEIAHERWRISTHVNFVFPLGKGFQRIFKIISDVPSRLKITFFKKSDANLQWILFPPFQGG